MFYILIALASLIAYGQAVGFNFVMVDDYHLVVHNTLVTEHSWSSIWGMFSSFDPEIYIPLTLLTYFAEAYFFGVNPHVMHATNILLHTLNSMLVFACMSRLMKHKGIALITALFFAVHPINTEAVAWISSRKDVLSSLFFLLSLRFFLKSQGEVRSTNCEVRWSLLSFVIGLLCKVQIAILPLIFILIDWYRGEKISIEHIKRYIWFFVFGGFFVFVGMFGKIFRLVELSMWERLLLVPKSIILTFSKAIFPQTFSIIHPQETVIALRSPDILLPVIVLAVLLLILAWSIKRTRIGVLCFGFFFFCLLPHFFAASKGTAVYFMTEKYSYLALIGFYLVFACSVVFLAQKKVFRLPVYTLTAFIILSYMTLTALRLPVWQDGVSYYENLLQRFPYRADTHMYLGKAYGKLRADHEKALVLYDKALDIDPNLDRVTAYRAESLIGIGQIEEGERVLLRALEERPDYVHAHYVLGLLRKDQGRVQEALEHLRIVRDAWWGYEGVSHEIEALEASL